MLRACPYPALLPTVGTEEGHFLPCLLLLTTFKLLCKTRLGVHHKLLEELFTSICEMWPTGAGNLLFLPSFPTYFNKLPNLVHPQNFKVLKKKRFSTNSIQASRPYTRYYLTCLPVISYDITLRTEEIIKQYEEIHQLKGGVSLPLLLLKV